MQVWGSGAQPSNARLRDGLVYREAGPWGPIVLALLRHLEEVGFAGAPRMAGSRFAADGREMLSFIPGASPQPYARNEDAAAGWGCSCALVDFEFAGPVDAAWELAQAAWLNAQLHDDDVAEPLGLPDLAGRGRQLRLIRDGYGLPAFERGGFVDKMITFAVHSARAEAVEFGVTPQSSAGSTESGCPFVWAITWRVRSASWMLTNRSALQRAIS